MAAQTLNAAFPSIRLEVHHRLNLKLNQPFLSFFPIPTILCRAASKSSSSTSPLNKRPSSSSSSNTNNKNKSKTNTTNNNNSSKVLHDVNDDDAPFSSGSSSLPKPPAGFVVDDCGKLLTASAHRLATLVDPTNNRALECVVRRVFPSSQRHECMLLCPVDMPVQILKSTGVGWSDVNDEELESVLPTAAYALAEIRMYLVYSGYCYTARGGFFVTRKRTYLTFIQEGAHYMIYTPSDPLLFVVVKDQNGELQIVDDELLVDPAVISAIDEETEFNALVKEEEAALLDSLLGKR